MWFKHQRKGQRKGLKSYKKQKTGKKNKKQENEGVAFHVPALLPTRYARGVRENERTRLPQETRYC